MIKNTEHHHRYLNNNNKQKNNRLINKPPDKNKTQFYDNLICIFEVTALGYLWFLLAYSLNMEKVNSLRTHLRNNNDVLLGYYFI